MEREFQFFWCGVSGNEIEGSKFSVRDADLPFTLGPVDYAGWVCTFKRGAGGKVRVIEGDHQRMSAAAVALNVDVAGRIVADSEYVG